MPGLSGGMSLIETHALSVRYGEAEVLRKVDLSVERGEIVTVVGPNGCGKSTLLRALLGVVTPSGGRVVLRPGLRIGYVPQRLAVDAALPMRVRRFMSLPERRGTKEVDEALDRVGAAGVADKQLGALSGGQLQRVLLARALLVRPEILILDEPTQGLDQPGVAGFYKMIEELRRDLGCAVLLVSHDLHVVMSASDRVICLNGHVCCQGTPSVVRDAPEYRALFGQGTGGALALYQHAHDHTHDHDHDHDHDHSHTHDHVH